MAGPALVSALLLALPGLSVRPIARIRAVTRSQSRAPLIVAPAPLASWKGVATSIHASHTVDHCKSNSSFVHYPAMLWGIKSDHHAQWKQKVLGFHLSELAQSSAALRLLLLRSERWELCWAEHCESAQSNFPRAFRGIVLELHAPGADVVEDVVH